MGFGTDHKKFLRHLQRAHITEEKKKDRMYKCTECAPRFDYVKNLERHMAKHKEGTLKEGDDQQEKEFVCDQCGKIYGNYKSWFYHVRSHSVIYQCQTCPRGFKTPRGLKYHMALHTGIAASHCGECGKAFITRDKLILHQKSRHSNERPHACEWCGKGFLLAHKLAEHRRRVHTGEKPFMQHVRPEIHRFKFSVTSSQASRWRNSPNPSRHYATNHYFSQWGTSCHRYNWRRRG